LCSSSASLGLHLWSSSATVESTARRNTSEVLKSCFRKSSSVNLAFIDTIVATTISSDLPPSCIIYFTPGFPSPENINSIDGEDSESSPTGLFVAAVARFAIWRPTLQKNHQQVFDSPLLPYRSLSRLLIC
ncbi:hypothetical protein LSH36_160g04041, partial [Paralvinella palmiformis]